MISVNDPFLTYCSRIATEKCHVASEVFKKTYLQCLSLAMDKLTTLLMN